MPVERVHGPAIHFGADLPDLRAVETEMAENLRIARPFLVLLALITAGRWVLGARGVPYEKGTFYLSIVTLVIFSSLYYAAFARRWLRYTLMQAVVLCASLSLLAQVVIVLSTAVSYALGLDTYFSHHAALNADAPVGFAEAMGRRLGGLVTNTIAGGILGALGWVLGALLPEGQRPA